MKAFLLKEEDFEKLLTMIDRDPQYVCTGGGNIILSEEEREANRKAHRFFNYQIRTWIESVKN